MQDNQEVEKWDLTRSLRALTYRRSCFVLRSVTGNHLIHQSRWTGYFHRVHVPGKRSMSRQKEQENGNPQYRKSIGEVDLNNEPPKPEKIHFISYARKRMTQRESVPSGVEFNNQCQSRDWSSVYAISSLVIVVVALWIRSFGLRKIRR